MNLTMFDALLTRRTELLAEMSEILDYCERDRVPFEKHRDSYNALKAEVYSIDAALKRAGHPEAPEGCCDD